MPNQDRSLALFYLPLGMIVFGLAVSIWRTLKLGRLLTAELGACRQGQVAQLSSNRQPADT